MKAYYLQLKASAAAPAAMSKAAWPAAAAGVS
jgi:hypothetical protein